MREPRARRIVVFGTYQADAHPRVRVLMEGLRAAGNNVVEINEPLGLSTAQRVSMLQKPWTAPVLPAKLLVRWVRLWRRGRAERRRNRPDVVLVGYMGHFDVHLARLVFRGSVIALDHLIFASGTALDRGARPGLVTRALALVDTLAMKAADLIVLDTIEHRSRVPERLASRAVVAAVGADSSWFGAGAAAAADPGQGEPVRVIFYGLFTPLQGAVTIGRALKALDGMGLGPKDISVTMVGSGQDLAECKDAAGADAPARWIDWVASDDLPAVVAAHHIALGIFGTTAKAAQVVPNKVYQAAAAGCAIVTSDTPPQRRVLQDHAEFVPPGDHVALASTLAALVGDRERLGRRRRQARELARDAFSGGAVIGELVARLPSVPTSESR
ncbi:Glycosyltransferase involved in cell wall bisynthesis [Nakamurella panacisegetis]|uniref:Glycosyltransferase involved in cell wall bisynthesis n=1 Tax=Nakamurella panacisegetis TaxID=1090615 RepID=A0A1H0IF10_9ACTN|nr:glycosyltransferase [Nakamurella panacisegetis]SDO29870.1 Glycosyltransferase involved in cell wall bisynthesis [Nakamurella panacisegetis]